MRCPTSCIPAVVRRPTAYIPVGVRQYDDVIVFRLNFVGIRQTQIGYTYTQIHDNGMEWGGEGRVGLGL